jgi:uncharacterized membrane protein YecN with MAPEG domain
MDMARVSVLTGHVLGAVIRTVLVLHGSGALHRDPERRRRRDARRADSVLSSVVTES